MKLIEFIVLLSFWHLYTSDCVCWCIDLLGGYKSCLWNSPGEDRQEQRPSGCHGRRHQKLHILHQVQGLSRSHNFRKFLTVMRCKTCTHYWKPTVHIL